MQFELKISFYDLVHILKELVGSLNTIDVYVTDNRSFENCLVLNFDESSNQIVVKRNGDSLSISVDTINRIEFGGFHKYNGRSSKIFLVE
jgi:hypothetical protein